jgi:hypothetical protein
MQENEKIFSGETVLWDGSARSVDEGRAALWRKASNIERPACYTRLIRTHT